MSREIPIPGGTAVLRDKHELTERHRRPVKIVSGQIGPNAEELMQAVQAGTAHLDERQSALVFANQDAMIWCYLKSWSLPQPVPNDWHEIGNNIPADVYDALLPEVLAQAQEQAQADASFGVDGVEDEQSPTGPSAA